MKSNETLINAKYVYLDWNVFKYMKEPRKDKKELDLQFKETVIKLKKKYKFPFSFAHIRDRANHYSKEYYDKVREDFDFVKKISESVCVGVHESTPTLGIESIQERFEDYLIEIKSENFNIKNTFPFSLKVDVAKIDKEHPMYEFLEEREGIMTSNGMETFLQELYQAIFQDVGKYKKLRSFANKFDLESNLNQSYSYDEGLYLERLICHLYPFLSSFQDDVETLKKKWPKIAERWFSINNKDLSKDLLLIQGYTLLDMHPLFNEKLKKGKNTLDNILRDGNHCFFASKANYFVSEDDQTRTKVSFLYDVYGIKTKVVSEYEFLNYFS